MSSTSIGLVCICVRMLASNACGGRVHVVPCSWLHPIDFVFQESNTVSSSPHFRVSETHMLRRSPLSILSKSRVMSINPTCLHDLYRGVVFLFFEYIDFALSRREMFMAASRFLDGVSRSVEVGIFREIHAFADLVSFEPPFVMSCVVACGDQICILPCWRSHGVEAYITFALRFSRCHDMTYSVSRILKCCHSLVLWSIGVRTQQ